MMTVADLRRMRRALAADPSVPLQVSGDELAYLLGLTNDQLRERIKYGDLDDLKPASDAVLALARKLRDTLRPTRFST